MPGEETGSSAAVVTPRSNRGPQSAFHLSNSPVRTPQKNDDLSASGGFKPATWPPEDAGTNAMGIPSPGGRSSTDPAAEETLLARWQAELGDGAGQAAAPARNQVLGLHRVSRMGDKDGGSDDDLESDTLLTLDEKRGSAESTTKTSTTISKVVEYIGKRIQEVHTEMQSPRRFLDSHGVDDPDWVAPEVVFPPATQKPDAEVDGNASFTGSVVGSSTARSGSRTARHIVPQTPFLFARVVSELEAEPEQPFPDEQADQNAVVEWWSNLVKFRPSAPSKQAMLIRETHEKLEQYLMQKDEIIMKKDQRIEILYSQAIWLGMNFKFSYHISHLVSDL